jgi:hypothetical protein
MTDGHIVNKKIVKILEEWHEQILPLHWENLDDKKKTEIISINDFYCSIPLKSDLVTQAPIISPY